jgi:hypothetical protein
VVSDNCNGVDQAVALLSADWKKMRDPPASGKNVLGDVHAAGRRIRDRPLLVTEVLRNIGERIERDPRTITGLPHAIVLPFQRPFTMPTPSRGRGPFVNSHSDEK